MSDVPLHPVEQAEIEREKAVESAVERLMEAELERNLLEADAYGHDFDTHDRRCRKCGMSRIEYEISRADRRPVCVA